MNYIDLLEANSMIQKIDFKGKSYGEVTERIKAFRYLYPKGTIETELLSNSGEVGNRTCIFKAKVYDENGYLLGTGTAYEQEGNSYINKTSYIENCETSAVGRALSMAGFSINTTIMSYEEITNADLQQEAIQPITELQLKVLQSFIKSCKEKKLSYENILNQFDVKELKDLNRNQYGQILLGFKKLFGDG